MSQTLQVLRCFSCGVFQVQIKKKSKRWECKLCGEKQSVMKIYGEGSGKDCRLHVQKLNEMRGMQEEAKKESLLDNEEDYEESSYDDAYHEEDHQPEDADSVPAKKSKWSDFLDEESEDESPIMIGKKRITYKNIPGSRLQGQSLENLTDSNNTASVEQPFFTASRVMQPKLLAERGYKHHTLEDINTSQNQTDPSYAAGEKMEKSFTQVFDGTESKNSNKLKSKEIFCATNNDELDELLDL